MRSVRPIPGLLLLSLLALLANGQQSNDPIPAGTRIAIELKDAVDSRKAHAGDTFRAEVLAPVLSSGRIVLPQGAVLLGRVLAVDRRSREAPESRLRLLFERAEWRSGNLALNAYVVRQLILRRRVGGSYVRCRQLPPTNRFLPGAANPFLPQKPVSPVEPPPSGAQQTTSTVNTPPPPPPKAGLSSYSSDLFCPDAGFERRAADPDRPSFSTPELKDVQLRRLPGGATELVSSKRDLVLKRGQVLEVQVAAE